MLRTLVIAIVAGSLAAGCGRVAESRYNPFNWFGKSEQAAPVVEDSVDRAPLVQQVTSLQIDPTPGGAILRAVGLPPAQGYYDGQLERVPSDAADVIEFLFLAVPPANPVRAGSPQSREIEVAVVLSLQDLDGIRRIRVSSAGNALIARR